ncbi:hypothetical protein TBLA_0C06980 [Henningerozyma blattae CBS 6284]|uniref:Uncharacterized protein n=1 Tax=Henningerozyma blattae (strain ATCC 34711 / CBS 6284 / DSM 70876 / NBRC 10599 / NRRL Y-10934 / UCD 77-7) TaxID=1071380 RepID=I2H287_HENB6|nr:hypothetical protein TBLA_0C06980 [Tetrapisispora blattae CBS 6284]CCH60489.1 hypothetical protein TBLA_0C06980 [Tetrapisispora blattae CBS 6284]
MQSNNESINEESINSFEQFLKESGLANQQNNIQNQITIICTPNNDTLQTFLECCFKPGGATLNYLDTLGYNSTSLVYEQNIIDDEIHATNNIEGKDLVVANNLILQTEFYSIKHPLDTQELETLSLLLKDTDETSIQWWVLLDWSIGDQSCWLNQIKSTFKTIEEFNKHKTYEFTLWTVNSEHMYSLQRNFGLWSFSHMNFIQQTLRSLCLKFNASLIYIDTTESHAKHQCIAQAVLTNCIESTTPEMVNSSSILIPKIKTHLVLLKF